MKVRPAFVISFGLRPAARAYWEIFSHVTENSGIAELPQIKPFAHVPARLSAVSALPPVQSGGGGGFFLCGAARGWVPFEKIPLCGVFFFVAWSGVAFYCVLRRRS